MLVAPENRPRRKHEIDKRTWRVWVGSRGWIGSRAGRDAGRVPGSNTTLADGAVPPANVDGNFIIGPTHNRAPELDVQDGVPKGTVEEFTMSSADSKFYPGIARDANTF